MRPAPAPDPDLEVADGVIRIDVPSETPRSRTCCIRSGHRGIAGFPDALRPSIAPCRSASERFWLSFAFALDALDRELEPDDALELTVKELERGIRHRPRLGARALVQLG